MHQPYIGGGHAGHSVRLGKGRFYADPASATRHEHGLQMANIKRGSYPPLGLRPDGLQSQVGGAGMGRIFTSILRERLLPAAKTISSHPAAKSVKKSIKRSAKQMAADMLSDAISGRKGNVKNRAKKNLKDAKNDIERVLKEQIGGKKKGGGGAGGKKKGGGGGILSNGQLRRANGIKEDETPFYEKTTNGGIGASTAGAELSVRSPIVQSTVNTRPSGIKRRFALI